ncbi:MAG: dynamin family protein [Actinomycetota bacterium]
MTALLEETRVLLAAAERALTDSPALPRVAALRARLDEPLRVAFAGRVKAGKSTLLNALVGEELAPTDAGECTRVVTWYRDGHTYRVTLRLNDGTAVPARFTREEGWLDVDLGDVDANDVERIDVEWPSRQLAEMTLIDTPGLGSASGEVSERARQFLAVGDAGEPTDADAVIYLMRHLHQADLSFLEAFHDRALGAASPANTVAVLSRADEVGACRPEAMQTARRIAARYRADPRLRRLSQTVLPVAGLLAEASTTLTEAEYRALKALADEPAHDTDELMLTVDRFVADRPAPVTPVEREALLARLGLYGVRNAVRLLRLDAASGATELAARLRAQSGIDELRHTLTTLFAERADLLKARAALSALEAILAEHDEPGAEHLGAELERIVASAHELVEVHVLSTVRSGLVPLRPEEVAEIDLLLAQPGASAAERLGVAEGVAREAVLAAIDRWKGRGEHALSNRAVVETSYAVVRTLEGILVGIDARHDSDT